MPYDPAIPLLGIHTEETRIERDTCTPMFIAALFTIARTWKQPRCPSADEWIRKLWYIYTMDYYSAVKKNSFESVLMRWMKLEPIIQSEVPMQYCSLQHRILLLSSVTSTARYCFCFGSIPSFFLELFLHIRHLLTWGVPLSVSYHFAFSYFHGVLKARILKWFAIPFSSEPHFVRPLHHDPPILGCPTGMA